MIERPHLHCLDTISYWSDTAMIEVVVTDEFKTWYEALSMDEQESVFRVVTLLEGVGCR